MSLHFSDFWVYRLDAVSGGRGFVLVGRNLVALAHLVWLGPRYLGSMPPLSTYLFALTLRHGLRFTAR